MAETWKWYAVAKARNFDKHDGERTRTLLRVNDFFALDENHALSKLKPIEKEEGWKPTTDSVEMAVELSPQNAVNFLKYLGYAVYAPDTWCELTPAGESK